MLKHGDWKIWTLPFLKRQGIFPARKKTATSKVFLHQVSITIYMILKKILSQFQSSFWTAQNPFHICQVNQPQSVKQRHQTLVKKRKDVQEPNYVYVSTTCNKRRKCQPKLGKEEELRRRQHEEGRGRILYRISELSLQFILSCSLFQYQYSRHTLPITQPIADRTHSCWAGSARSQESEPSRMPGA